MTREENIRAILESNFAGYKEEIIDIAVKRICEIEQEPKTIPIGVYEQVRRERDIAVEQLNDLGYELGEKPRAEQEPKTGWIPVSERLPKKDKYKDFCKCLIAVDCTSRHDICDTVTAYFDGKHFYRNRYDRCFISGVKGWMPLPKPYEESEGKE